MRQQKSSFMNFSVAITEIKSPVRSLRGGTAACDISLFFSWMKQKCHGRGSSQNSSCERLWQGTGVKRECWCPTACKGHSPQAFIPRDCELNPSRKAVNTRRHLCAICSQGWAKDLSLSSFFYQILLRKQKIRLFFGHSSHYRTQKPGS